MQTAKIVEIARLSAHRQQVLLVRAPLPVELNDPKSPPAARR